MTPEEKQALAITGNDCALTVEKDIHVIASVFVAIYQAMPALFGGKGER